MPFVSTFGIMKQVNNMKTVRVGGNRIDTNINEMIDFQLIN